MLSVSDNTYNMYDCCGNIGGILGEGIKLVWVEPFQNRSIVLLCLLWISKCCTEIFRFVRLTSNKYKSIPPVDPLPPILLLTSSFCLVAISHIPWHKVLHVYIPVKPLCLLLLCVTSNSLITKPVLHLFSIMSHGSSSTSAFRCINHLHWNHSFHKPTPP